jgi:tetratricopeptide (TPR) repeat protein
MFLPFLLLQTATPDAAQPLPTLDDVQFEECLKLARTDAASAVMDASLWGQQGGGYLAKACHGFALASDFRFAEALPILSQAAQGADAKGDPRAARFWAQAGNAAIADNKPAEALVALDQARASPASNNAERADIEVDRGRTLVALGQTDDAAKALANARTLGPENGTAWLLSATLARRMENIPDAVSYIQTAASLLPRDPAVALEAGNIAIAAGDEATARKQWEQVIAMAPISRQANSAQAQLAALSGLTPPPETQSR